MERIIKFRGKRKYNGEWVYGNLAIDFDGNCTIFTGDISDVYAQTLYEVIPESVGQFTGLYDSTTFEELTEQEQKQYKKENWKGRKIWEKDILKSEYGVCVVKFGTCNLITGIHVSAIFYMEYNNKNKEQTYHDEVKSCGYFKVIGNTADNPELLKEGI